MSRRKTTLAYHELNYRESFFARAKIPAAELNPIIVFENKQERCPLLQIDQILGEKVLLSG